MDGYFPKPEVDGWLPVVVQVVADTLVEHGYAEVRGVPGDQQATLRTAVRARVRERTGHASHIYAWSVGCLSALPLPTLTRPVS